MKVPAVPWSEVLKLAKEVDTWDDCVYIRWRTFGGEKQKDVVYRYKVPATFLSKVFLYSKKRKFNIEVTYFRMLETVHLGTLRASEHKRLLTLIALHDFRQESYF